MSRSCNTKKRLQESTTLNMNNHQEDYNYAEVVVAPTPPIITSTPPLLLLLLLLLSSSSSSVLSVVLSSPQQPQQLNYAVAGLGVVITSATIRGVLNGQGQGVECHLRNVKYRTLGFVNIRYATRIGK